MSYGGASGGSGKIATAGDAALSNPSTNDVLMYDGAVQKWYNAPKSTITAGLQTDTYATNQQTGSAYTLALTDAGKVVENTAANNLVVTVPTNSAVAFPIGTTIEFLNYSTGSITLSGGGASGGGQTAGETFTGTDASPWPSQWSALQLSGSSASSTIQSNAGRLATGTDAYACIREYLSGMSAQADTDLSFTFKVGSQTNTGLWLSLSSDNTVASNQTNLAQNCYAVFIGVNPTAANGSFAVYSIVNNGTPTTFTTGTVTVTAGTTYGMRFQRSGTVIRFRIWDSSTSEPASWTWSGTDTGTQPPAGKISFAYGNSNDTTSRYVDFDGVIVASPSAGSSPVALRSVAGLRLTAQYAPAAIRKRSTDEWIVTGATVV